MAIITHDTSGITGTRSFCRAVVNIYGVEGTVTTPPEWSKMESKIDFFVYAHEICPHRSARICNATRILVLR
jgi:hypothetical protein